MKRNPYAVKKTTGNLWYGSNWIASGDFRLLQMKRMELKKDPTIDKKKLKITY